MIDRGRLQAGVSGGTPPSVLSQMSLQELLELRAAIDRRLPARKLSDLDIEEELLLQFHRTKDLYDRVVQEDAGTPANQRAQVANSCSAILEQLIRMQTRLYSAERIKLIEQVLIRTMKEEPEEVQKRFFERYERALTEASLGSAG